MITIIFCVHKIFQVFLIYFPRAIHAHMFFKNVSSNLGHIAKIILDLKRQYYALLSSDPIERTFWIYLYYLDICKHFVTPHCSKKFN